MLHPLDSQHHFPLPVFLVRPNFFLHLELYSLPRRCVRTSIDVGVFYIVFTLTERWSPYYISHAALHISALSFFCYPICVFSWRLARNKCSSSFRTPNTFVVALSPDPGGWKSPLFLPRGADQFILLSWLFSLSLSWPYFSRRTPFPTPRPRRKHNFTFRFCRYRDSPWSFNLAST